MLLAKTTKKKELLMFNMLLIKGLINKIIKEEDMIQINMDKKDKIKKLKKEWNKINMDKKVNMHKKCNMDKKELIKINMDKRVKKVKRE